MKRELELTETIHLFSGILYELQEEDYEQTKHQGFDDDQELPISLEGNLIDRYTKELFVAERTYLVMMEDENPPSLVAKGWNIYPKHFPAFMSFYTESNFLIVTETDGNFVTEVLLKNQ